MKVFLLGQSIGYSASPAMHNAAFKAADLEDWSYELLEVGADELGGAVESLRRRSVAGANVTIPHKVAVAGMVDTLDPYAPKVGAINTVVNDKGKLRGLNTDVDGIRAALREVGVEASPQLRVLTLGAGGSARAVAAALDGCRLVFACRTPEKADLPGTAVPWEKRAAYARDADVLVNATPLGRQGEQVLDPADLPRAGAVVDLVYTPAGTPLLAAAAGAGLPTADGWTVLVAQGAASFEAWTGRPAPVQAMREAVSA